MGVPVIGAIKADKRGLESGQCGYYVIYNQRVFVFRKSLCKKRRIGFYLMEISEQLLWRVSHFYLGEKRPQSLILEAI